MSKTVRFKLGLRDPGTQKEFNELNFVLGVLDHMQGVMGLPPEECSLNHFAKVATMEAARHYVSMVRRAEKEVEQREQTIPDEVLQASRGESAPDLEPGVPSADANPTALANSADTPDSGAGTPPDD